MSPPKKIAHPCFFPELCCPPSLAVYHYNFSFESSSGFLVVFYIEPLWSTAILSFVVDGPPKSFKQRSSMTYGLGACSSRLSLRVCIDYSMPFHILTQNSGRAGVGIHVTQAGRRQWPSDRPRYGSRFGHLVQNVICL